MGAELRLVVPSATWGESYRNALEKGWSPSTLHDRSKAALAHLLEKPEEHYATMRGGMPAPSAAGDGQQGPRASMLGRWMWDGDYCGWITLRYMANGEMLPPHILGNIGYSVVSWKQNRGYATQALLLMMQEARHLGLRQLRVVCVPENAASIRVLEKCGARYCETRVFAEYEPTPRALFELAL